MNILEALKAVEDGKYIRFKDSDEDIHFIFQTVLHPFQEKGIVRIELNDAISLDEIPRNLHNFPYEEVETICLETLKCEDYEEISFEEMMKQLQAFWIREGNE